jgi:hypothetical protein
MDHEPDDFDETLGLLLIGEGRGWVLVILTLVGACLLLWHYFG